MWNLIKAIVIVVGFLTLLIVAPAIVVILGFILTVLGTIYLVYKALELNDIDGILEEDWTSYERKKSNTGSDRGDSDQNTNSHS